MAEISGAEGSVTLSAGYDEHVFRWNISYVAEELEVTAFGDSGREYIGGFKSWSGSCEAWLSDSTALVAPGAKVSGTFIYGTAAATSYGVKGDVVITSIEPSVHIDGSARSVVVNFRGSGVPALSW